MAGPGDLTDKQADDMVVKVRADRVLPTSLRARALRVAAAAPQSVLAIDRLKHLARAELPDLPRDIPRMSLSRVTGARNYLRYHASPEFRESFLTTEDFIQFASASSDVADLLLRNLDPGPHAIPWDHSWLAPTNRLRGLDGAELVRVLELGSEARPPFVKFNLPLNRLLEQGVLVRAPCSLDSVLGGMTQWSPSGLASGIDEFVDGNIPTAAVESIEWVV